MILVIVTLNCSVFSGSIQEPFQRSLHPLVSLLQISTHLAQHHNETAPCSSISPFIQKVSHPVFFLFTLFSRPVSITCWLSPLILPSQMSRNHLCVRRYPAVKQSLRFPTVWRSDIWRFDGERFMKDAPCVTAVEHHIHRHIFTFHFNSSTECSSLVSSLSTMRWS